MPVVRKTVAHIKALPRLYTIGAAVVILVAAALGVHVLTRSAPIPTVPPAITHVQVASVSSLSSQVGPLSIVGTVTSESQATILAQTDGELVSLPHAIGDQVAAGDIIGEFENSSQQAAVTQAEGAYESAQAALAKAQGTTAANSGITSAQSQGAAQNAATALQASLQSLYAALDDAVHTKADAFFTNPRTASPTLQAYTIPDSQLISSIQNERPKIEQTLQDASAAPAGTDLDGSASSLLADAQTTQQFLNTLITAFNEAVPNQSFPASAITAAQATLAAARTEVDGAIASLTASKSAYDAATAGAQTAANSAQGGTQNDITAAQASLKSAQGALDAAQANLEKTIIRSPISGTIVSLPVSQGDYLASFAQVAVVSNPSALYVDAQVTGDDAKTLAPGGAATIDGDVAGVITFVAPALDPSTGKIEVKVGITGDQGTLTDGEAVSLALGRASSPATQQNMGLRIPIIAAKITPQGPVVFTVTASSTLEAHPITLGTILGDQVVVSGIAPDLSIVTDARGLSDGQGVVVDATSSAL